MSANASNARERFQAIALEVDLPAEHLGLDALISEWPKLDEPRNGIDDDLVAIGQEVPFINVPADQDQESIINMLKNRIRPLEHKLRWFDLPIMSQFPLPPPIPSAAKLLSRLPMMNHQHNLSHLLFISNAMIETLKAIIIELKEHGKISIVDIGMSILELLNTDDEEMVLEVHQAHSHDLQDTSQTRNYKPNHSTEVVTIYDDVKELQQNLFGQPARPDANLVNYYNIANKENLLELPDNSEKNYDVGQPQQEVPSVTDCSPPMSPPRLSSSYMRVVLKTHGLVIRDVNDHQAAVSFHDEENNVNQPPHINIVNLDVASHQQRVALSHQVTHESSTLAPHSLSPNIKPSASPFTTKPITYTSAVAQNHDRTASHSVIPNIKLSNFSPKDRVAEFAKLRGRMVEASTADDKLNLDVAGSKQTYDGKVSSLVAFNPNATQHKYIISTRLLQHRKLAQVLNEVYRVDFVERDLQLSQPDLVIDEKSCVLYYISELGDGEDAIAPRVLSRVRKLGKYYEAILIILEQMRPPSNQLFAAISPFADKVTISWNMSAEQSARQIRAFGDAIELNLSDASDDVYAKVWKGREWLTLEETQQERFLVGLPMINSYAAQIILCQMSLRQCLSANYEELVDALGQWLPSLILDQFALLGSFGNNL